MTLLTLEIVRLAVIGRRNSCCIFEMTITTLCRLPLVDSLCMASPTFRDSMGSPQRESAQIVIELSLLPEVLSVTLRARYKCSLMHVVFMMTCAALLTGAAQDTFVDVTFSTIQLQVNSDEQEVFMILRSILPATFVVTLGAEGTISTLVHIFMASLAIPLFDFREKILAFKVMRVFLETFIGIFMTFGTLHLLMLTLQFELSFLMIEFFQSGEFFRRMADTARLIVKFGVKHILVFVQVTFFTESTIGAFEHKLSTATRWFGGQSHIAGFVAFSTFLADLRMLSCQLKPSDIVLKFCQLGKTIGRVTGAAGLFGEFGMELLLVHCVVTVCTVFFIFVFIKVEKMSRLRWLRRQLIFGRHMAFFTVLLNFLMLAVNLEVCHVMIEGCSLGEIRRCMTLGTRRIEEFFVKLLLMNTVVTADTEVAI